MSSRNKRLDEHQCFRSTHCADMHDSNSPSIDGVHRKDDKRLTAKYLVSTVPLKLCQDPAPGFSLRWRLPFSQHDPSLYMLKA